ncbi:hypothetical protein D9M72_590180 [compost metagenome]
MVVGDDEAGGINDEAGAERINGALTVAALATLPFEELVEIGLVGRALRHLRCRRIVIVLDLLRGRDVDDRVQQPGGEIGNGSGTVGRRANGRVLGERRAAEGKRACQRQNAQGGAKRVSSEFRSRGQVA